MSRSGNKSSDGHPTKIAGLYDLEETLGRGHFAVVKLARHVFTGEKVAVKVIDKTKLDPVSQDHLYQEVRCMKLVQHPNVVRLYEVIDTNSKLYLILELGDGGDLYDYIMKHDAGLSEEDAREYFAQIVRAISFCHKLHVVHRDLKPENVVFFERLGVVKLTDFGFSNRFNPGQKLETSCGSLAYSAPEILLGDSYDAPAVDVWSLGVILYMLVAGQAPFQEANDSETLTMIMDVRYKVPDHVTDDCKRLIGRMLVRDPGQRATLAEIATDPWLLPALRDESDVPLVSRETVSDEDHNFIVTKMVNGKIASKEDILEALDKDEYNHITATYYLLAERKLRLLRTPKNKPLPPTQATSSRQIPLSHPGSGTSYTKSTVQPPTVNVENCSDHDSGGGGVSPSRVNQALLSMTRHPGDVASRSRKCSIVTEEEDDDEEREMEAHDRRGSRSEGKLNLAVAELRRESILLTEASTAPTPLQLSKCHSPLPSTSHVVHPVQIKILPSALEAGMSRVSLSGTGSSGVVNMKKLGYRTGGRTASVSSSEASDEDEARHSRRGSTKSLGTPPQPPPPGGGGAGGSHHHNPSDHPPDKADNNSSQNPDSSNNNSGGSDNSTSNNTSGGTMHSNSPAECVPSNGPHGNSVLSNGTSYHSNRHKRRGGETRLRESQSLNRITEVVETEASAHFGCETGIVEVEPSGAKENVCFRCCMEEMCSIEKRLVCETSCAGRTEQNNNMVKEKDVRNLVENSLGIGNVELEIEIKENVKESIAGETSLEPRIEQAISPNPSLNVSQTRNLTNVYSRQNKHRYIHNNNNAGKMTSSISCSDIPDGNTASGNTASEPSVKSENAGAVEKSSRKLNTLTRIRNRHNKENSSSDGKSKQELVPSNGSALPSNGSASPSNRSLGTNQNVKTSVTSNGQPLPVVNKNKKSNKNSLINRYLYLQKKLVMPLFGGVRKTSLKSEGRLYKAKSCSEVEKTSCTGNSKINVLSKNRAVTMTRCSKHVTECTTGPLKLTASIVNIDHRTSTAI